MLMDLNIESLGPLKKQLERVNRPQRTIMITAATRKNNFIELPATQFHQARGRLLGAPGERANALPQTLIPDTAVVRFGPAISKSDKKLLSRSLSKRFP